MGLKDKKTKITFHCGNKSIGGTLIEVKYEKDRIVFDMGSKFDNSIMRNDISLAELIDHNLTSNLPGIFEDKIQDRQEKYYENSAVFISHCHLDHSNMINLVDSSVKVYASKQTKSILEALNIENNFLISHKNFTDNFTRQIEGLEFNEAVNIGDIKVQILAVDHDAYGSSGFIITTPDMTIAYTGDIRFHGYRPYDSYNFCKKAAGCDLLIMEGVTISFADLDEKYVKSSELKVINEIEELLVNNKNKNVSFNIYIANIERIENILKLKERKVVFNANTARLIKNILGLSCFYYKLDDKDYGLDSKFELEFNQILNDKGTYFWQNEGLSLEYLSLIQDGSIYIHSDAAPLGDFDPNYLPFVNKFSDNNIEMKSISCSGHASPRDLFKIIEYIKPKYLVPFHSFRPEKLYNKFGETILPEEKETI